MGQLFNPACAMEGCENPRRSLNPRGIGGFYCPSCRTKLWQTENPERHRENVRASKSRRRDAIRNFLRDYKTAAGCTDCGYNEHPAALEFDHLPEFEKSFNLSTAPFEGIAMERVLEEIAKCEVVCANCHAIRTAGRREEARDALGAL